MAAHRYWRLYITANNGRDYCGISSMNLSEVPDGANLVGSATIAASSTYPGGYAASNVADSDVNTFWHSLNNALPEWLSFDFGAGVTKDITTIIVGSRNDGNGDTDSPNSFNWQWSDDGSSWTTYFSVSGETAWVGFGETRRFTNYADPSGQILYSGQASGFNAASSSSRATSARATTTGRHMFVAVSWSGADTTASVTDTAGNTYTSVSKSVNTATAACVCEWFKCTTATGHASNVVTASLSAARSNLCVTAVEVESSSVPSITSLTAENESPLLTAAAFTSADQGMYLACSYTTTGVLLFIRRNMAAYPVPFVNAAAAGSYVGYLKVYDGGAGEAVTQPYGSDTRGATLSVLLLGSGAPPAVARRPIVTVLGFL